MEEGACEMGSVRVRTEEQMSNRVSTYHLRGTSELSETGGCENLVTPSVGLLPCLRETVKL